MGTMRTWRVVNDNVEVLIDGQWGMEIIPQQFARDIYSETDWINVNPQDITHLREKLDETLYLKAWENLLKTATCTHREYPNWTLRQNEKNLYIVASEEDWQGYLADDSLE